jgi:L-threonylcarbamoyladenylate synthase
MTKTRTPIEIAAALLSDGEVVAIPTETVYGLAGNMYNENAVAKIYELKKRPKQNPLIVHVADINSAIPLIEDFPTKLLALAEKFMPGPLTLLLNKSGLVPNSVTAGSNRVAIRVPAHPLTAELLKIINIPLVAPSANPYTRISPTKVKHVEAYFGNTIPYILDGGPCQVGLESTIVGMEEDEIIIYRKGVIGKEDLEKMVGPVKYYHSSSSQLPTPGLAPRHYAPATETLLCERDFIKTMYDSETIVLVFSTAIPSIELESQFVLSESGSLAEAAKNLYQLLHTLDEKGFKKIICEQFPEIGIGVAINDRLRRASTRHNQ